MTKRFVRAGLAYAALLAAMPAFAHEPDPMREAARDLGTPKIGYTARNDAHTSSMFEFVRSSETVDNWTKLFTVVATSVEEDRTPEETEATIRRLHAQLLAKHAVIAAYEERHHGAPTAFFNYSMGGETDVGVVFSPFRGVVTVQQVAARRSGVITAKDIRRIKSLLDGSTISLGA